jgi:hypothetical protein
VGRRLDASTPLAFVSLASFAGWLVLLLPGG